MGITLPGRSEGNLTAATPCRLQLCAVLGSSTELDRSCEKWSIT